MLQMMSLVSNLPGSIWSGHEFSYITLIDEVEALILRYTLNI